MYKITDLSGLKLIAEKFYCICLDTRIPPIHYTAAICAKISHQFNHMIIRTLEISFGHLERVYSAYKVQ